MKFLSLLTFLIISTSLTSQSIAQYKCHHQNCTHHGPAIPLKSAANNLRSDTIDVLHYHLNLDFTEVSSQILKGEATIQFSPNMDGTSKISLDLLSMNIDSITQNNAPISFSYNDTLLVAHLDASLNSIDTSEVTVFYHGVPQKDPSGWGGFYFDGNYAYNLGVGFESNPHNFGRSWHPCFDNFTERATYEFHVLTNNNKKSYCNGYLDSETVMNDSTLRVWKLDETIPTYLASVATGNLTHATLNHTSSLSGQNIPIWLIAEPGDTSNFKSAFTHIDEAIDIFEGSFGQHTWNKVGFVAVPFSSGAMEHPTNISYPRDVLGGITYETLMAHEFAHHWWGDLVTCETENEMWINEGMATYSEHLFIDQLYGYEDYLTDVKANHRDVLVNAHASDNGHYALSNVPHAYTYGDHSYNKGADVMHSLRGYMGDAAFFTGLKSIITNYQFTTINSTQFRDEITNSTGIDVTDFFENWILNPGFPQFSIDSLSSIPAGGNHEVTIYTKQRLRAAPTYYTGVPFQVTFMDNDWNKHTETVTLSGENDMATFTVPFQPDFAFLNEDHKINQAVTADQVVFKTASSINHSYSDIRPYVDALTDSAMVRTELNWVAADDFIHPGGFNAQFSISPDRYWSVKGILGDNFAGRIRFAYRGQTSTSTDALLFDDGGSGIFHEDSIRILYRPAAGHEWSLIESFTLNTGGSATDKFGYITIDTLAIGDYCLGWISGPVSIDEQQDLLHVNVFPNPASDLIWIDLSNNERSNYEINIYDLNGKIVAQKSSVSTHTVMDIKHLRNGAYLISVLDDGKFIHSEKLIID